MKYLQKLVKLQLVKVIEHGGVEHFYVDFFSDHDFNQIKGLPHDVIDEVLLPLSHCEAIRDNFRALYKSYESDEASKAIRTKIAYKLKGEKFGKVRNWMDFYTQFSDDFLPE